jgi:LacI family transcriptional regulator
MPVVVALLSVDNHAQRAVMAALNQRAATYGWHLLESPTVDDAMQPLPYGIRPDGVFLCPKVVQSVPPVFRGTPGVAIFQDLTAEGVPSIDSDNVAIGAMAAGHLISLGIRRMAGFRYVDARFANERMSGFRAAAEAAGATHLEGGDFVREPGPKACTAEAIQRWLLGLPKPCAVYASCDNWARVLITFCAMMGLRVPEDIAVVGTDNDPLVCEHALPQLTSVVMPWHQMGTQAADMLQEALRGSPLGAELRLVSPTEVAARRSSAAQVIADEDVRAAVDWIRRNAAGRCSVAELLRAVPVYRRRLERKFRSALGRTINSEIRRARVEIAKELLSGGALPLGEVAKRAGFQNQTAMGIAVRRETGKTPARYRQVATSRDDGILGAGGAAA